MSNEVAEESWIITGADPRIEPCADDEKILEARVAAWNERAGARPGDFVIFTDGKVARFSHDWDEGGLQTSPHGQFHMGDGHMSFSGSLDPSLKRERLTESDVLWWGEVWFFHRSWLQAHSAIYAKVACRVFRADVPSDYWLRPKGGSGEK